MCDGAGTDPASRYRPRSGRRPITVTYPAVPVTRSELVEWLRDEGLADPFDADMLADEMLAGFVILRRRYDYVTVDRVGEVRLTGP